MKWGILFSKVHFFHIISFYTHLRTDDFKKNAFLFLDSRIHFSDKRTKRKKYTINWLSSLAFFVALLSRFLRRKKSPTIVAAARARKWVHHCVKPRNIYLKGYFIQVKIRNRWHFALSFSSEKFPRICAYFLKYAQLSVKCTCVR